MSDYTIFVVDDSVLITKILESLLKNYGFNVEVFTEAKEALVRLQSFKPHVILSDYMMPEMDGFEFCRIVKDNHKTKDIKFILVTALDDIEAKVKCFEVGADDYIVKPFNNEEVLARIKTHISIKQLQDDLQIALSKIERELEEVGEIQKKLLPKSAPKFSNIIFDSYYNTFSKSGGDYFDFIEIDENLTGILIVDVAGHGTSSTVIMAILKVFLTQLLNKIKSPSEVLNKLNQLILDLLNIDKFATVFYGILNMDTLNFIYANAAHPDPLIINKENKKVEKIVGHKGLPVGILPMATGTYKNNKFNFNNNSRIILYTDGIIEAKDENGKLFGEDRLISLVADTIDLNLKTAKEVIINELYNYTNEQFNDDVTMVMFDILK